MKDLGALKRRASALPVETTPKRPCLNHHAPVAQAPELRLNERDFECSICLSLLCQPVSVACGHSFCKTCLVQCQVHQIERCPVCRASLPPLLEPPSRMSVNVTLQHLIERVFPRLSQERLDEVQKLTTIDDNDRRSDQDKSKRASSSSSVMLAGPARRRTFTYRRPTHLDNNHSPLALLCTGFRALFPGQEVKMVLSHASSMDIMRHSLSRGERRFGYLTSTDAEVDQWGTLATILHIEMFDSLVEEGDNNETSLSNDMGEHHHHQTTTTNKRLTMHLVIKGLSRFKIKALHRVDVQPPLAQDTQPHDNNNNLNPQPKQIITADIEAQVDIEEQRQTTVVLHQEFMSEYVERASRGWIHQEGFRGYYLELSRLSTGKVAKRALVLMRAMMSKLRPEKAQAFHRVFGSMPMTSAIEFSFWLANIVGLSVELRSRMLETSSLRIRLALALFQLERIVVDEHGQEQPRSSSSSRLKLDKRKSTADLGVRASSSSSSENH